MKDYVILQNEVKRLKCGDQIYSAHRHDFKRCSCGNIAVDSGMSYLRRVGGENGYEDLSVSISKELYTNLNEAINWAEETGRNNLGMICALARAIRDSGYKLKEIKNEKK